jgi:hypothetical protein
MDRTAQFGGVGGGGSGYAPGGSPLGRGNMAGGGYDVNRYISDRSLDAILRQVHNPAPIDPERNMEKRLEDQHQYAEDDLIPYDLSHAERERLKIRKQIRQREQSYEEAARSIRENSPAYIKEHFTPKEQHITPFNVQLQSRRKTDDKVRIVDPREDQVPPQIKPSRFHPVLSQTQLDRVAHQISRPNQITDEDSNELNWADKARRTQPLGLGSTPLLETGMELDQYLEDSANQDWGGQKSMSNEPTAAFDFENPDEFSLFRNPGGASLPSSIGELAEDVVNGFGRKSEDDILDIADDPFMSLETKLEKTNRAKPERAPADNFPENRWELHENEATGIQDSYKQRGGAHGSPWKM